MGQRLRTLVSDAVRRYATGDDDLGGQDLDDLVALIAGLGSQGDHPAVRARTRRRYFQDLALHPEDVARARRPGPADLSAGADDAARDRRAALHQESHGDRRRVPAARRQAGEQRALRGLVIEVEGLRIELAGEGLDLRRVHRMRSAGEPLPDPEIVEIEAALSVMLVRLRHRSPRVVNLAAGK